MNKKQNISLWTLFFSMITISAFTFGGGFVIISMMRKKFCDELHWVTDDEVLDMTAIAQSAPGPLGVNSAVIFGYRIKGIPGALTSVLAMVIPPIVIISIVCMIYDAFASSEVVQTALRVMRAGVAAIIADVVIGLAGNVIRSKNVMNVILMIFAFIAAWVFMISSVTIILLFIALGTALYLKNGSAEVQK